MQLLLLCMTALLLLTSANGLDARTKDAAKSNSYTPPPPPQGGRIVSFRPSKQTKASVPVFANSLFKIKGTSNAKRGVIGLTGKGRDGSQTFPDIYQVVADHHALAVPNFYEARDRGQSTTDGVHASYLNATRDMVWPEQSVGSWVTGEDAAEGGLGNDYDLAGAQISSYDVIDQLVRLYSDKSIYPNMQDIVVAGHSAGGKTTVSYSYISDETPEGIRVRYVHLNSPSSIFSESHRPLSTSSCSSYQSWPYGPQGQQPRYVSSRLQAATFARWVSRDVVRVTGNADTQTQGDDSDCGATVQGGRDRLSRNYGAWVYENMLAGTKTDLSEFKAYKQLQKSGLKSQNVGVFNKRLAIVDGVGHDSTKMFASRIGRQSILDDHIDQGPLPTKQ